MLYHPKKIDYTSPASAQGGPGVQKQITHYFGTPYIDMTAAQWAAVSAAIGARLGDIWWLGGTSVANGGNAFMFVRATVGLTLGQVVATALPTTGTLTIPGVPVSTSAAITTNISNVAAGVNGEVDNWLFVNPVAGFATPQLRRIKANDASATGNFTVAQRDFLRPNSPTDADVFDGFAVFANADPLCIIRPHRVIVNTATTTPVGIALGTVTAASYTVVQVAGLACVSSVGNVTALAPNVPAVGAAAGVISGSAAGAANLYTGASLILPQIAQAAAGPIIIPCYVNFTGQ